MVLGTVSINFLVFRCRLAVIFLRACRKLMSMTIVMLTLLNIGEKQVEKEDDSISICYSPSWVAAV
jgi:hypothetical protein